MKILLSALLLISLGAKAQKLDTVIVRNLQWKYETYCYLIGGINPKTLDSADKKRYKIFLKFLDDANPAGFSTLITYDLPGKFAMFAFNEYWEHHELRDNAGTEIDTKLRLYPALTTFIASADAARLATFLNRRNAGRDEIE